MAQQELQFLANHFNLFTPGTREMCRVLHLKANVYFKLQFHNNLSKVCPGGRGQNPNCTGSFVKSLILKRVLDLRAPHKWGKKIMKRYLCPLTYQDISTLSSLTNTKCSFLIQATMLIKPAMSVRGVHLPQMA